MASAVHEDTLRENSEARDHATIAAPDVQEQPASAPTSEQADDDVDVESCTPNDLNNDQEIDSGGDKQQSDEDDLQVLGHNCVVNVSSESEEGSESGEGQGSSSFEDSGGSDSDSDSIGLSSFDGDPVIDGGGGDEAESEERKVDPETSQNAEYSTDGDGYPDTGLGTLNVPAREPRPYEWVSSNLLASPSYYEAGPQNFKAVLKKINSKSGRISKVEGMKPGEHIAT